MISVNTNVGSQFVYGIYNDKKLEWMVIKSDESEIEAILINADIHLPYNSSGDKSTWKDSSLRKWLNDDFYNNILDIDKEKIVNKNLKTVTILPDKTTHIESTEDRVYILSGEEINFYKLNFEKIFKKKSVWVRTAGTPTNNAIVYSFENDKFSEVDEKNTEVHVLPVICLLRCRNRIEK